MEIKQNLIIKTFFGICLLRHYKEVIQRENNQKLTHLFILHRKYENDNLLAFNVAHRHQIISLFMQLHVLRYQH